MQSRSLLNANNQFVTLKFEAPVALANKGYVWTYLKQALNDQVKVDQATRMTLTSDGKGAVFDVPHSMADTFIEGCDLSLSSLLPAVDGCSVVVCGRFAIRPRGGRSLAAAVSRAQVRQLSEECNTCGGKRAADGLCSI